jgi:hypothetical protein
MDCPYSRIDIIGTNGNDGLHYAEVPLEQPEKAPEAANDEEGIDLPDPPLAA